MKQNQIFSSILASSILFSTTGIAHGVELPDNQITRNVTATEEQDFFFEDGVIKKYLGTGGDVVIPSSIGGEIVRAFQGFEDCTTITSVTLPDTLASIGRFTGCSNLKSVYIPDSMPLISLSMGIFEGLDVTVYGASSGVDSYETVAECIVRWEGANFISTGTVTEIPDGYPSFDLGEWYIDYLWQYSTWAEPHVMEADENKIIPNSLGRYFYNDILRFQIAETLVQLVEVSTATTLSSSEVTFSDTALTSVAKAFDAEILNGMGDGSFGVSETATREQIAVMMVKTIDYLEKTTGKTLISRDTTLSGFSDTDDISDWARDSMAVMVNNQIMSGVGDGQLSPRSNTTIEQCFVMLNQIMHLVNG